jgi:hypothetical protein
MMLYVVYRVRTIFFLFVRELDTRLQITYTRAMVAVVQKINIGMTNLTQNDIGIKINVFICTKMSNERRLLLKRKISQIGVSTNLAIFKLNFHI